jgi:stage III sporulation protein SpoIIIAA
VLAELADGVAHGRAVVVLGANQKNARHSGVDAGARRERGPCNYQRPRRKSQSPREGAPPPLYTGRAIDRETQILIDVLPEPLRGAAAQLPAADLVEIVLDFGRPAEARLADRVVRLGDQPVERHQLLYVLERVGPLSEDNRAGVERTLHRISAIRNRKNDVIGLTLRVGRAVFGTIDMVRDLVESGRNLLLLGRPGVGKTTKLREIARVLADDLNKRVVVVDTSNEIGGDGDVPHPGIGNARRMQVARPDRQHAVMIEAVENHMPEAIVVDEIGTAPEAAAARTIAERGVQLIGTAHGTTLENLILNPTLSDLVGGIHTVTLSDEEARRRRTPKTITERRGPPTFDSVVELIDRKEVLAHRDTAESVDRLLAGRPVGGERRRLVEGRLVSDAPTPKPVAVARPTPAPAPRNGPPRIYPHAISREVMARVLDDMQIPARIVDDPARASVVLALRARANDRGLREAAAGGLEIHTVKKNSSAEMRRVLRNLFGVIPGVDEDLAREATAETEAAVARVLAEGVPVSLAPRPPAVRKMQHRLVSRHHLEAASAGHEPFRHLVIYPTEAQEQ